MLLPFVGFSQKKENGTIYIEHPAIDIVDAFTKAMVKGDTAAMAELMTDDFKAYDAVPSTPYSKGDDKASYLAMASFWFNNLDYYSIEAMGDSYPDAFEYLKDPSDDNAVTVESWDILKGVHKTTGVKIDSYFHRSFTLTKGNKIRRLIDYLNPEIGNNIRRAYSKRTNGIIYSEHENINMLRLMIAAAENGDGVKYYSFYDEKASFWDLNLGDDAMLSLEEQIEQTNKILESFDIVSIEQVGYPDYMEYEMGGTGVLYSWWNYHLERKSDKEHVKVPMHFEHTVNEEGKIVNQISFYVTPK